MIRAGKCWETRAEEKKNFLMNVTNTIPAISQNCLPKTSTLKAIHFKQLAPM